MVAAFLLWNSFEVHGHEFELPPRAVFVLLLVVATFVSNVIAVVASRSIGRLDRRLHAYAHGRGSGRTGAFEVAVGATGPGRTLEPSGVAEQLAGLPCNTSGVLSVTFATDGLVSLRCGPGAPACPVPLAPCSGACVNLSTDEANCGACGRPCLTGELCQAGVCSIPETCVAPASASPQAVEIFAAINSARQSAGRACLQVSASLSMAAQNHATYMAIHNQLNHTEVPGEQGFTGVDFLNRVAASGYTGSVSGELIAAGSSAQALQLWLADSPHREVLLEEQANDVGAGEQQGYWSVTIGKSLPPAPTMPGDLVITEIMADPARLPDAVGEWFEVFNPTSKTLLLTGLIVQVSSLSGRLTNDFTIDRSLVLPPGRFAVFGNNGNRALNGGVGVDFTYPNSDFLLNNFGDQIEILNGAVSLDRVTYTAGQVIPGVALSLTPNATAATNDNAANWCPATDVYGAGDRGSPGSANPRCPSLNTITRSEIPLTRSESGRLPPSSGRGPVIGPTREAPQAATESKH